VQRDVFGCFCPECAAKGNVLDLWAAVHGLPLAEAAKHLAQTFGLDLPNGIREEEPVLPRLAHAPLHGNADNPIIADVINQPPMPMCLLTQTTKNSNSR